MDATMSFPGSGVAQFRQPRMLPGAMPGIVAQPRLGGATTMPGVASQVGGGSAVMGMVGSSGDPYLDTIRNTGMADAAGRMIGARRAAMSMAPNDPSMAAFAGMGSLIGGQSDAAHNLNSAAVSWMGNQQQMAFQERMLRLRAQLNEDAAKRAAGNQWLKAIGAIGGTAVGAYFGGPAGAAAGGSAGGSLGSAAGGGNGSGAGGGKYPEYM